MYIHEFKVGPPSGEPVVLLHGLGSSWEDWFLQVPALSGRYRVFAVDLPGHGRSSAPQGWPSIAGYATEFAGSLEALKLPATHVVGLSLGGLVGLQTAVEYPQRVRTLTVINGFSRVRFGARRTAHALVRLLLLLTGRMEWLGAWVAGALFPEQDQGELRLLAAERIASNPRRAYLQALAAVASFKLDDRLDAIECPTLIVAGGRDKIVPLRAKRRLAAKIRVARFVLLAESGHLTPVDDFERFNRILVEFLGSVDQAGATKSPVRRR